MLNYENVSINLYINLSEVIKQDLLWFDSIWFSRIDTVLYNSILFDYRMKSIDIHKSRLLPPSLSTTTALTEVVGSSYQQHILSHVFFISWRLLQVINNISYITSSSYLGVNNSRLGWGFYTTYLQHIT